MSATPDSGVPHTMSRIPIDDVLKKRRDKRRKNRDDQRDDIMKMVSAKYGFATVLAEHLGIKPQAVSQWNRVPPQYVVDIAPLLGMTPEQIRPDVFRPRRK